MHTHPADPQVSRDGARPNPILVHRSNLLDRHGRLAALVDPFGLGSLDTSLLALSYEAPFEFGDHPQYRDQDRTGDIGRREFGSSTLRIAPFCRSSWTRFRTSRVFRPNRSSLRTTSSSPSRTNSMIDVSSSLPLREPPEAFSLRMIVHPALRSRSCCIVRSCPCELHLAYPIFATHTAPSVTLESTWAVYVTKE